MLPLIGHVQKLNNRWIHHDMNYIYIFKVHIIHIVLQSLVVACQVPEAKDLEQESEDSFVLAPT